MPWRLTSVVFEAADVAALADFWASEVDGWAYRPARGEVRFVPTDAEDGPVELVIAPAPRRRGGKNRIHLDLNTHGMQEYQTRRDALALAGARPVDIGQGELVPWTVFADQEGNEFCLLKPRDRYRDAGRIAAIVVDCADPEPLARFWSAATGWEIVESEPGFAALRGPGAHGPFLEFSRVADRNPEPSPVSLGFESYWAHQHETDLDGLCALGARVVGKHDGEVSYTVLADPEGNEFRVVIPVWPPPTS
ncbi:MAG TPA: VOC family protein [Actinophytocola sp.]|uniref:VOC family protein n=1 Tax=Actinophytocola sp. TaxID=1872138 RepID=UPI002DDCDEC2|nr:VOC family protein [Actinophytocola sp.]HEV2782971.1 VOC family protein [Actinophytocola sp.]